MSDRTQFHIKSTSGGIVEELITARNIIHERLSSTGRGYTLSDIDSTHKTFINVKYTPPIDMYYDYYRVPVSSGSPTINNNNLVIFELKQVGQQFYGDMVIHIKLAAIGTAGSTDKYFYCDFPAVRLCKLIEFYYDNQLVDSYNAYDVMFDRQFVVPLETKRKWDECMGQEQPIKCTVQHTDYDVRQYITIGDGSQTPKSVQSSINLWVKLHFDFNRGIRNAFYNKPSFNGKREIRITFEDPAVVLFKKDVNGVVTGQTSLPAVQQMNLYMQNIYFPPLYFLKYLDEVTFRVIKTHTSMNVILTDSNSSKRLDRLRYITESIRFGFLPVENERTPDKWYVYNKATTLSIPMPVSLLNGINPPILSRENAIGYRLANVVDELAFYVKDDVFIYPKLVTNFYKNYMPTRYDILNAPDDSGSMCVTFNVEATYGNETNGFYNLSYGDPMIIEWTSSNNYITPNSPCILIISAISLRPILLGAKGQVSFLSNNKLEAIGQQTTRK
jgi:hypothetical protein